MDARPKIILQSLPQLVSRLCGFQTLVIDGHVFKWFVFEIIAWNEQSHKPTETSADSAFAIPPLVRQACNNEPVTILITY